MNIPPPASVTPWLRKCDSIQQYYYHVMHVMDRYAAPPLLDGYSMTVPGPGPISLPVYWVYYQSTVPFCRVCSLKTTILILGPLLQTSWIIPFSSQTTGALLWLSCAAQQIWRTTHLRSWRLLAQSMLPNKRRIFTRSSPMRADKIVVELIEKLMDSRPMREITRLSSWYCCIWLFWLYTVTLSMCKLSDFEITIDIRSMETPIIHP